MSRGYGREEINSCGASTKELKKQLKEAKQRLKTYMDIHYDLNIAYESKHQIVGSLYLYIQECKERLSDRKKSRNG